MTGGRRDSQRAVNNFRHALAPWRQPVVRLEEAEPAASEAWHAAAIDLGIAHDVLASHVGPRLEALTLHASVLNDQTAENGALLRLSAIVDVAALAVPHLARQPRREHAAPSPEFALLERHTLPLWTATAQLTEILRRHPWTSELDRLPPSPRLRLPTANPDDPLGTVNAAIDLIGRLTVEQVHRPGPHSIATFHLVNGTVVALLGHAELLAQSVTVNPVAPTDLAYALGHARTAWFDAGRALAGYPPLAPAPELLTKAALMARRTMAALTRIDRRWRSAAEIADTMALVGSSASSLNDTLDRLALLGRPLAELARHCAASGLLTTKQPGLPGLADRRLLPYRPHLDPAAVQQFADAISAIRALSTTRPSTALAPNAAMSRRRTVASHVKDRRRHVR